MQDVFADAMEQLLGAVCTPAVVRAIEQNADRSNEPATQLWSQLIASGFADATVPENRGGAGLSLPEIFSIVLACGRHALPLPFAQTLLARGLHNTAQACPAGAITIANAVRKMDEGSIECAQTPFGLTADWVIVDLTAQVLLLPASAATRSATGVHGSLDADLRWDAVPDEHQVLPRAVDWRIIGATVSAALMAGALERVLELTLNYANERSQFGKPIGKLQAVQQQLSVMAEEVFAAKMAAQIAFISLESPLPAAVAKARASEAAPRVAAIAHAVHGAMGFTEEYDLQLYTRRLHEWRLAYGAEQYWNQRLGQAVLERPAATALDFIRQHIFAATPES